MRELLFRGQTRRFGERLKNVAGDPMPSNWVYGGVFHQNDRDSSFSIIYSYDPVEKFPVYADTVGQYTGIPDDENETKIFEDDIVKVEEYNGNTKVSDVGIGIVSLCNGIWFVSGNVQNNLYDLKRCYHISVIGNIHDNPELIKDIEEAQTCTE